MPCEKSDDMRVIRGNLCSLINFFLKKKKKSNKQITDEFRGERVVGWVTKKYQLSYS